MNKTQLIDAVSKATELKKRDVEAIVENLLDTIADEVAKGEKVQIMGFGNFERRENKERTVKNPRTGEPIQVAASKSPFFSASKVFKDKVNQ